MLLVALLAAAIEEAEPHFSHLLPSLLLGNELQTYYTKWRGAIPRVREMEGC